MVVYRFKQLNLASPERIARLKKEVEEGLHAELFDRLGLESLEDKLARIEQLPYLSPSLGGTLLQAARSGEAAVDHATAGAIDRLLG